MNNRLSFTTIVCPDWDIGDVGIAFVVETYDG